LVFTKLLNDKLEVAQGNIRGSSAGEIWVSGQETKIPAITKVPHFGTATYPRQYSGTSALMPPAMGEAYGGWS